MIAKSPAVEIAGQAARICRRGREEQDAVRAASIPRLILSAQLGQRGLDPVALRLQEGRQLERSPERLDRLIDREPRRIGRDLEKDVTPLAEIDRAEILPVLLLSGGNAAVIEGLRTISA